VSKVSNIPTPPEKREEIKQELTDRDGQATKMQINSLKKALKMLREKDSNQEPFIAAVAERQKVLLILLNRRARPLFLK